MIKKTIRFLTILNISLAFILLMLFICINFDTKSIIIYRNIYAQSVALSSLNKESALDKLNNKYNFNKNLILTSNDKIYEIDLKDFNFKYNMEDVVVNALNIGKDGKFLENISTILELRQGNYKNLPLIYEGDFDRLSEHVSTITADLNTQPVNAKIVSEKGKIKHIKEINGNIVDIGKLTFLIKKSINNGFEKNTIEIPIIEKFAKIKLEDINMINTKVASYSTRYPTEQISRAHNVVIGCQRVNNLIVMPGEIVSFNDTIGEISIKTGFKYAPIISNGRYVPGAGGGVCQISSTLYNSLLYAGLEIIERHPHSKPQTYVPYNRDATVSPPHLDLKFKNNKEYPIFIINYAYNGVITSEIYSTPEYK